MLPVYWLGTPEKAPRCVGRWRFAKRRRRPSAQVGHRGVASGGWGIEALAMGRRGGGRRTWGDRRAGGGARAALGARSGRDARRRVAGASGGLEHHSHGGGGRSSRPTRRVRSRSRTRCGNGLGAADGGPSFEARAHALLRGGRRRGSDRRDIPGRWRSGPRVVPAGGVEPSGRIPACGAGERLRLHQDGGQPARPRDRHGIGRAGAGPEVRPLDAELHRPEWIPVYGVDRHPDPHHQRRLAHRSPRARARVSNWPCRAACCGPRVGPLGSGRAMRCHSRWWARRLGIPTGPAWSATTPRFCNRDFDTSRATGYIRFW